MSSEKGLKQIKRSYVLGNYSKVIQWSEELESDSKESKEEASVYEYLSKINLGELDRVKEELMDTKSRLLEAVYYFNEVLVMRGTESFEEVKVSCIKKFEGWLVDPKMGENSLFRCVSARFFSEIGDIKKAMQSLWKKKKTPEMYYSLIMLLLSHERVDLAKKMLQKLRSEDDLILVTQIAEIFYNLKAGGENNIDDALKGMNHLVEKYGETGVLLNAQASGLMLKKKFSLAEKKLLRALGEKGQQDITISNLIVCQKNLKKPKKTVDRYVKQLENLKVKSVWIAHQEEMGKKFDKDFSSIKF